MCSKSICLPRGALRTAASGTRIVSRDCAGRVMRQLNLSEYSWSCLTSWIRKLNSSGLSPGFVRSRSKDEYARQSGYGSSSERPGRDLVGAIDSG